MLKSGPPSYKSRVLDEEQLSIIVKTVKIKMTLLSILKRPFEIVMDQHFVRKAS
jgi:hypothetical protein